ncbi:MAG TPA: SRPBCC domain-containing protein [Gemmatimonadaceae bacterium]
MKEYTSTAIIAASAETVWTILTDGAQYRQWNPEIVGIDGRIELGERITAHVRLGSGAIRTVAQRVTSFDALKRMEWVGGLPLGLFVGRRSFTVTPVAGGVEFKLHLRMSGPLSSLILRSVGDRQPEIDSFSAALKSRAEKN